MRAKKRVTVATDIRTAEPKPKARPVGMQTMGPMIYEQIRQALVDLEPKLVSEN